MEELNLWLVLAQIINFWILLFIFKHFLGEKIVKAIEERRGYLSSFDDAEVQLKEKLEKADKDAADLVNQARKQANEIESNADTIAKKNIEKSKQTATQEADSILGNARADIEKERLSMTNLMKSKVVDLTLKLNSKMFNKESANKDFMEKELEALK